MFNMHIIVLGTITIQCALNCTEVALRETCNFDQTEQFAKRGVDAKLSAMCIWVAFCEKHRLC